MLPTPPAEPSTGAAVPDMLGHAVQLVLATMARREVRRCRAVHAPEHHGALHALAREHGAVVVGTIGFVGAANGFVYLYLAESLARELTGDVLSLGPNEVAAEGFELVRDTIGEITNIIAGTFKNQLGARGLACQLTIPSILHGPPFEVEVRRDRTHWACEYETGDTRFVVDVLCDLPR